MIVDQLIHRNEVSKLGGDGKEDITSLRCL